MLRYLSFDPPLVFEPIGELHRHSSAEPVGVAPDISECQSVFAVLQEERQDAEVPAATWRLLASSRQFPGSVGLVP